ncbi:MAG: hypothetical protein NT003_01250 [Candidatus Magasanikbacteria bacterium]|nr:hypothetical protein [Candidatus Magasanikbacteria bacterium]
MKLLAKASDVGRAGAIVTAGIYHEHGISDAAIERLVCNACDLSPEFVGENPISWNQLSVGVSVPMRGDEFVVVEINQLTHVAWLIRASQLEAAS